MYVLQMWDINQLMHPNQCCMDTALMWYNRIQPTALGLHPRAVVVITLLHALYIVVQCQEYIQRSHACG